MKRTVKAWVAVHRDERGDEIAVRVSRFWAVREKNAMRARGFKDARCVPCLVTFKAPHKRALGKSADETGASR